MFPILGSIGPITLYTHDVFTTLGLLAGLGLYYRELRGRGMLGWPIFWISITAIVSGAIGARVVTAWEHLEYYANLGDVPLSWAIEHSGKSLLGGLAGGYLGVVLAKRGFRYTRSTGDCYAIAIPVATMIGRVGCFLSELPLGTPTSLPWGISVNPASATGFAACPGCAGPMHPSMVYEIAFNALAVAVILRFRHRVTVQGDLLKGYLVAAGLFRFLVEFVRGNEVQALGLTGPQLVLAPLVALLALHFLRQLLGGVYRVPEPPRPPPRLDPAHQ